jgi:hypothetical protein
MAGANTSRVMKMLVTNSQAANVNSTVSTIVDNEILLVDKFGVVVGDTATAGTLNSDSIKVALGIGTAGVVEYSQPIQLKNIRKVTSQAFVDSVQHVNQINGAVAIPSVVVGENYSVKITHHDLHQVFSHKSDEFYTVKAVTGDTATTILTKLKAKVDANKSSRITATMSGANLILSGKAITSGPNASILNQYMFSYFHIALKSGFDAYATGAVTITAGTLGNGLGKQVRDLEKLSTQSYYRDYTSFPNDDEVFGSKLRATATGKYNIVVIEHGAERSGDLGQTFTAPATTIIAFATTTGAPSVLQNSFMVKLASIVESMGVFVS